MDVVSAWEVLKVNSDARNIENVRGWRSLAETRSRFTSDGWIKNGSKKKFC